MKSIYWIITAIFVGGAIIYTWIKGHRTVTKVKEVDEFSKRDIALWHNSLDFPSITSTPKFYAIKTTVAELGRYTFAQPVDIKTLSNKSLLFLVAMDSKTNNTLSSTLFIFNSMSEEMKKLLVKEVTELKLNSQK